ncbi:MULTISPECIES: YcxB family protein [Exiguobacterium]|uniref:YcxB family protein n=1 Tax=Exiguobacterium TaxID=33986 RepID=UPI0008775C4B|nr:MULTISPECIES: YcxB family protein [Exiguobacterium]TCI63524.1 YcxB family protein [Exiguobacterium sp. SH0S2]TCI76211.1 YcxB family protein [Exiguobacterium sp. SH0S1]
MEIQYELTEEDYIHFNLSHIRRSKIGKRMLFLQRIIGPVIILSGGALTFATLFQDTSWWLFGVYGVISLIWFLYYPKYFERHIRKQTKRMIQERSNEGMIGPHTMDLDEDGLRDKNAFGETKVSWSGIKEVVEEADYVYLYNSSVSAYILPKRGQDMEEVQRWLPMR